MSENSGIVVGITGYKVEPSRLTITVHCSSLWMVQTFVRQNYTTNNYGQGSKWAWWKPNDGLKHSEVREGAPILDALVVEHPVLSRLLDLYHIEGDEHG